MIARRLIVTVALCVLALSAPCAQERIVVLANTGSGPRIAEVDASASRFGEIRYVVPGAPGGIEQAVTMSGARYVVWVAYTSFGNGFIRVFDRRTRRLSDVHGRPGLTRLAADPLGPRLFLSFWDGLYELDARTLQLRRLADGVFSSFLVYASSTGQLYGSRRDDVAGLLIVAIDVATGLSRLAWRPAGAVTGMVVDATGHRLTVAVAATWGFPFTGLVTYDTGTGTELARRAFPPVVDPLVLHDGGDALLAATADGLATVLDARTLEVRRSLRASSAPGTTFNIVPRFSLLPGRWMTGAYVFRTETRVQPQTCNAVSIDSLAPDGRRLGTVDVLGVLGAGGWGCDAIPVLVRSPYEPTTLRAAVSGRQVALHWLNPGDVSDFEVQAGLAPGATMLTQRVGLTTSVAFEDVPPGVYYVRVRAFNEVGGSPVSNEVRVEVR